MRKQKRTKGLTVQPLARQEIQNANILLSDNSIKYGNRKIRGEEVDNKKFKDEREVISNEINLKAPFLLEYSSSRVLDRFQVSIFIRQCFSSGGSNLNLIVFDS